jgi:ribonucleotide reductase alpha subunit
MYSHISRNSAANKKPLTSGAEFGEYSTLFNENRLEVQPGLNIEREEGRSTVAQDDKKAVHTRESDTPVDQLYAQVDKKKKDGNNKKKDDNGTYTQRPEAVDQLYAQVDKKKKDGNGAYTQTPEAAVRVDQLYAQVDKKKKSKRK